jgi:alkylation response protein AidB-like acyl-CoA dehydrogenase
MISNITVEQTLVQRTTREIAQKELEPRAHEIDETQSFPWIGLRKLAEAGVLGMTVPSEYGGTDADMISYLLATENISGACASTALVTVMHASACQGLVLAADDRQKKVFLPSLAKGEKLGAVAVHEAASGIIAPAIETTASREGDDYVVKGSKIFTTSAGEASVYLVLAVTDKSEGAKGISLLLIEKDTPGLSFSDQYVRMGLNGTSNRELTFDNCHVPRDSLIGVEGDGLKLVTDIVGTVGMLGVGAIALGMAQSAFDKTIKHARERSIQGNPIGSNQAVQHMIAEMGIQIDMMRFLLYNAANEKDKSSTASYLNSFKAKLVATESAIHVIDRAIQIHGGHGYCKEYPLERYYRDARGLTLHFTASELLKANVGKMMIGLS